MPKYAIRRQCFFNCNNDLFESEAAFIDSDLASDMVEALSKVEYCCEKTAERLNHVFPANTKVHIFELVDGEEGGTEKPFAERILPSYLIVTGRIYDPERAYFFADKVDSECGVCVDRDEQFTRDYETTGFYDNSVNSHLFVQVKCNRCGAITETGDGDHWYAYSAIDHYLVEEDHQEVF